MTLMSIVSLSKDSVHEFSKKTVESLVFLKGLGIEGNAHCGRTVQHRSRIKANPTAPNLRQVHLIHSELFADLKDQGFHIQPGDMGENVLTKGIDLLNLPRNTRLILGKNVVLNIEGLRNPCAQLDNFQTGLTKAVLDHDSDGQLIRKAGVMATVVLGGKVAVGDVIQVQLPPEPHAPLERV